MDEKIEIRHTAEVNQHVIFDDILVKQNRTILDEEVAQRDAKKRLLVKLRRIEEITERITEIRLTFVFLRWFN